MIKTNKYIVFMALAKREERQRVKCLWAKEKVNIKM